MITDKKSDKLRVYNFSRVGPDRDWLQDLLLNDTSESSDDDSVTEEEIRREMKFHLLRKKYRKRFYSNSNDVREIVNPFSTIIQSFVFDYLLIYIFVASAI